MADSFVKQAIDLANKAIAADNESRFADAIQLYKQSIEVSKTALKYEKNPQIYDTLKQKMLEYLVRAEQLSKEENERKNPTNPAPKASGGSNTSTKKPGAPDTDGGDDAETKKLRGALSGAIVTTKPNIKWSDVAGLEGAKDALKEAVILPTKFPQLFTGKRKPWKGILLFGPPGTGKSFLAKAVATEADSTFLSVSSSDLVSKWQGESERLVKQMFEMAREQKPAIIFIDEIDSLCTSRAEGESESSRRIKTEFLVQMDGVGNESGGVLVLGATNTPWELDPAMRRRFQKRVYIALPETGARTGMFKLNLGDTPNTMTHEEFTQLGEMTEGYSGSDIAVAVQEAIMEPLRKCQTAKQFYCPEGAPIGSLCPCNEYPNCPDCPMKLSDEMRGSGFFNRNMGPDRDRCPRCNAIRISLYEIDSSQLLEPKICFDDFKRALSRAHSSIGDGELERFQKWSEEFGQDG